MILLKQNPGVLYTPADVRERAPSALSPHCLGSSSVISAPSQWSVGAYSVISAVSVEVSAVSAECGLCVGLCSVVSVERRRRLGG